MINRRRLVYATILALLIALSSGGYVLAKPGGSGGGGKGGGKGGVSLQAIVDITNPLEGEQFNQGSIFNVVADITCSKDTCMDTEVTISLPNGLSLPNNDAGHYLGNIASGSIVTTSWEVSADTSGGYMITASSIISNKKGKPHSDNVTISIFHLIFSEDVESGGNGWTATGLWHITDRRSTSPTHSWWYGNETTGTYETFEEGFVNGSNVSNMSTRNYGDLISPVIDLTAAVSPVLTFDSFWDTETSSSWDQKKVFITTDGGASWVEVHEVCPCNSDPLVWEERSADLSEFTENTVQIKFSFDTVDGVANNMEGWFVDDIKILD